MSKSNFRNFAIVLFFLSVAYIVCCFLLNHYAIYEHITTIFVFSIFLIAYYTDGYRYGILASLIAVSLINFAFTYPYYHIDFSNADALLSALVMISLSILTSTLTTKIKVNESIKVESEKERMRANLLRAVSHDLRTPLTTIYGFANILLEKHHELSDSKQIEILNAIKEDADWLIHMVENLLSITKLDSGQLKITKQNTVLDELIDDLIHKFNKRYPNVEIEIDIPDELIIIPMDVTLIEQVLMNLLENAVIHSKDYKHIKLYVFVIAKKAIFEVIDDGCGIDPKNIREIFKFTENKERPSDGSKQNMGIGLSVCKSIIKAHGGSIDVQNNQLKGCTFRFSLDMEDDEFGQQ